MAAKGPGLYTDIGKKARGSFSLSINGFLLDFFGVFFWLIDVVLMKSVMGFVCLLKIFVLFWGFSLMKFVMGCICFFEILFPSMYG